jgi:predicted DNA-binding transcriptional regulator YafY
MFGIIILEGDIMIEHIIKASMDRGWIITIIYSGSAGISERNIKVLEIHGNNIKAYCYLRKQVRSFRIENILSAAYFKGPSRAVS